MLRSLEISNYALIDELLVQFEKDFTILTGETGAGKSILLGALSLILGDRADHTSLLDKERKCIVEGHFDITSTTFQNILQELELDEEDGQCILRREILPGGRSRAFINDTPVKLNDLSRLGARLIDIHKQDDISLLMEQDFRISLIDGYGNNVEAVRRFQKDFREWRVLNKEYLSLKADFERTEKERDFLEFQLQELEELRLEREELETIEEDHQLLAHGVELAEGMENATQSLDSGPDNVVERLQDLKEVMGRMARHLPKASTWLERIESVLIELQDLVGEIDLAMSRIEIDPEKLDRLEERMSAIHHLLRKHHLENAVELIDKREELSARLSALITDSDRLTALEKDLKVKEKNLMTEAEKLHRSRIKAADGLRDQIQKRLHQLGMPSAKMEIRVEGTEQLDRNGLDRIGLFFSANAGIELQEIKKVTSGGERSRLMLAIKEVASRYLSLPTMIFDEIDTGVSGAIARKMGELLAEMGNRMQILAITHIPQIAALGKKHYHILKSEKDQGTRTQIRALDEDERIVVIAEMIGGKKDDRPSLENARALLGLN